MKFIVGLGNPGKRYASSWHNVGFLTIDRFREREHFDTPVKRFQASFVARRVYGENVVLLKPQTYMNRSGRAVRAAFRELAAEALQPGVEGEPADLRSDLLVVHDDLDLPVGKLRFRDRGSSGGHKGMQSVMEEIGTELFSRLRVGIGRQPEADAAEYVLEPLAGKEQEYLAAAAIHAADTLPVWIEEGIERCANRFNGPEGELELEP